MFVNYMRPLPGREGSFGKITEWKTRRAWLAHTTSRFVEEWQILEYGWTNGILPVPFASVLETQPLLLCRSVSPSQQRESPQHWIIVAEYSSEPMTQQKREEQQYPNPLNRPARIRWNSAKYNKPCIYDTDGNLILNSAGDPYDPPPEIDQSRWTATIQKNVAAVPQVIIDYTDAINESPFTIQGVSVGPKVAKIMSIEISDSQFAQAGGDEIEYVTFTYALEFRPETWQLKLLDQGYRQKDPNDSTKRIAIKDDATPARDISHPWPLNGSGAKLTNPTPSTAVKRTHNVLAAKDFSILPGINGA